MYIKYLKRVRYISGAQEIKMAIISLKVNPVINHTLEHTSSPCERGSSKTPITSPPVLIYSMWVPPLTPCWKIPYTSQERRNVSISQKRFF
jgi:hypothetical protein